MIKRQPLPKTLTPAQVKFIQGLNLLTLETGVTISGCGCCGTPFLGEAPKYDSGEIVPDAYYITEVGEFLEWGVGH